MSEHAIPDPGEGRARPVSPRQREANRRNAQKSTGPTTEAGKERASRNAITHGIYAGPRAIKAGTYQETQSDIDHDINAVVEALAPLNEAARRAAIEVATAYLALDRASRAEATAMSFSEDPNRDVGRSTSYGKPRSAQEQQGRNDYYAELAIRNKKIIDALEGLSRIRSRKCADLERTLKIFDILQARAQATEIDDDAATDIDTEATDQGLVNP